MLLLQSTMFDWSLNGSGYVTFWEGLWGYVHDYLLCITNPGSHVSMKPILYAHVQIPLLCVLYIVTSKHPEGPLQLGGVIDRLQNVTHLLN